MLQGIFIFLAVSVSWVLTLLFARMKKEAIIYNSVFAGVVCIAAQVLLSYTGHQELIFIISLGVFLFMMLAVRLQEHCSYGSSVISFLLSTGNFSLLCLINMLLCNAIGDAKGYSFSFIAVAVTLLSALICRHYFPEKDWENCFNNIPPEPHKLSIKIRYIYGCLGISCAIMVGGRLLMPMLPVKASLMVLLAFISLWFVTIFCIILLVHYRQETITVLQEQQYRSEVQSFMNVIRSQRHDYNFHVQTIARMVNEGNMEACRKYVNEMVQDSMDMNDLLPIKDPATSALVNSFQTLAAREGIKLHIDIRNDLSHVCTNVYETNKVISNLLQNAIDEVKTHDDKSYGIWLYIMKRGEYCLIHVANTFQGEISPDDYVKNMYRLGYTTKPGHDGVGLSSVRTLLEHYRGVIYTRVEENLIHFVAKIPLRYEKNNEDETAMKDEV